MSQRKCSSRKAKISPLEAKKAKSKPKMYVIRKAFALVIINDKFDDKKRFEDREGSQIDKENIEKFCRDNNFDVNDFKALKMGNIELKTDNLTADAMKEIFQAICDLGDFSSFDAFICFISSHGTSEGIVGVDGEATKVKSMTKFLNECDSLTGKPKLFFIQNCRGGRRDGGVQPKTKKARVTVPDNSREFSVTIPKEADILTAYSSVDGYESYRNKKEGSWFITELTKVLTENVNDMQLTDMLVIVSENVANLGYEDEDTVQEEKPRIWKQMPCYTSTLRSSVVFEIAGEPKK